MKRMVKMIAALCLIVSGALAAPAAWNLIQPYQGPGKDVVTLVITGNYRVPRLLADLIQIESRQPYLLLPAVQDVNQDVFYFCPVNPKKPALQVKREDFARFIRFVNPGKVIILGDKSYVATEYVEAISPNIPVMVITGDWNRAAATLGDTLNLSNLEGDFADLYSKIERSDALYMPEAANTKASETAVAAAPAASFREPEPVVEPAAPANTPVDAGVDIEGNGVAD